MLKLGRKKLGMNRQQQEDDSKWNGGRQAEGGAGEGAGRGHEGRRARHGGQSKESAEAVKRREGWVGPAPVVKKGARESRREQGRAPGPAGEESNDTGG